MAKSAVLWRQYQEQMVEFAHLFVLVQPIYQVAVRKNVAMPYVAATDLGAMATVYVDGGYGYAATGDTSLAGLAKALERAAQWARATARLALVDTRSLPYASPRARLWRNAC